MQTHRQGRRPYRAETLLSKDGHDHPTQRALTRTGASLDDVTQLKAALKKIELPAGTHHVSLGGGYAVLKDVGRKGKHHVVATVLSPNMRPPGYDMSAYFRKQADYVNPHTPVDRRTQTNAELLAKGLRPGDLVHTGLKPGHSPSAFRSFFYNISRAVQGTPYTHTTLYEGKGKVLELDRQGDRAWVRRTPLTTLMRNGLLLVQRPQLPVAARQDAVRYLKGRVGDNLSGSRFVWNAAKTLMPLRKDTPGRLALDEAVCSSLIADAYKGQLSATPRIDTRPVDFQKSPLVRTVAKYAGLGDRHLPAKARTAPSEPLAAALKTLQPGDILATTRKAHLPDNAGHRSFQWLSRIAQGTPYTHTALYAGHGRVLEMGNSIEHGAEGARENSRQATIRTLDLKDVLRERDALAFRPPVSASARDRAVTRLQARVGETLSVPQFLRNAAATAFKLGPVGALKVERAVCSTIIGDAYRGTALPKATGRRHLSSITPVDLQRASTYLGKFSSWGAPAAQMNQMGQQAQQANAQFRNQMTPREVSAAAIPTGTQISAAPRLAPPTARMAPMPPSVAVKPPAPVGVPQPVSAAVTLNKPSMTEMQKAAVYNPALENQRRRERQALWQSLSLGRNAAQSAANNVSLPQDPTYLAEVLANPQALGALTGPTTPFKDLIAGRRLPLRPGAL